MRALDRHNGWMRRIVGAGPVLLLGMTAAADSPAPAASGWDDRHMRSNFANYLREPAARRPILGTTRFEASASEAPATTVTEQILSLSPHGWQPGGPSGGSRTRARLGGSATFSSSQHARPQRSSIGRGSALSTSMRHHR